MKKLILFSIALISSIESLSAQVTSINLLYNSIPGIGCHSNMSVCTNTGSLPESGALIEVDWMDGSSDNMTVKNLGGIFWASAMSVSWTGPLP